MLLLPVPPLPLDPPRDSDSRQGLYDGGNTSTSELVANLTWVATCMCAQLLGSIERRPRRRWCLSQREVRQDTIHSAAPARCWLIFGGPKRFKRWRSSCTSKAVLLRRWRYDGRPVRLLYRAAKLGGTIFSLSNHSPMNTGRVLMYTVLLRIQ